MGCGHIIVDIFLVGCEGGFGMRTFDEVLAEDLKDPAFRRAYEASEKALQGFDEILKV